MSDRVPFSNGTEVAWFRDALCSRCRLADPEYGDCEEFSLGVVAEQGWPDLLVEVPRGPQNPLGIMCTKFDPS